MIQLQIYFTIADEASAAFEAMFAEEYVPALKKQKGYQNATLLRIFPPAVAQEIDAAETDFNYQMELSFDTEADRRRWVASPEHTVLWPRAQGMAQQVAWRGYDVVGLGG